MHIAQEHLRTKAEIMGDVIAKALADHPRDQLPIVAEKRRDGTTVQYSEMSFDDVDPLA